jgi:glycosyltransferase involved in cell wall biosynthesis
VLYVQYTNPAVYPPLLHSIGILADAGCPVRIVGLDTMQRSLAIEYPAGVSVTLLAAEAPGWRQKMNYAQFARAALREAAEFRPDWIYASDALSTPVARLLQRRTGARVVYHEHDTPFEAWAPESASWFMSRVMKARRVVAERADVCVVPNRVRGEVLRVATGRRRDITVVWNCPRRHEAAGSFERVPRSGLRVLFYGSIAPGHLPLSAVDALTALPADVELVFAGYEADASHGYIRTVLDHAHARGLARRVRYAGLLNRVELLQLSSTCDVGLALFSSVPANPNEEAMVGASNKVFEYLARGLPVLTGDRPDWRQAFESVGVARSCERDSGESIAAALRGWLDHPEERRAMGERGRRRVLADWNYEAQFAPVLQTLIGGGRERAAV